MDWPFVENTTNFVFDFHRVYAGVLIYLVVKRRGMSGASMPGPNTSTSSGSTRA